MMVMKAHATILVVKEYGVNNTYSSISAAITAAANNDTIVVYDKPSGQAWIENLTLDKNLWIIHPTQGTRFKAPGDVTIVPKAGMDLYILGWDMNGKSVFSSSTGSTATSASRAKITVADCINANSINLNLDWIDSRIYYNTFTGNINFRHGLAIANVSTIGGIIVDQESTADAQNDSILIIGNKARWGYLDTKEAGVIANNYFANDNHECNGTASNASISPLVIKFHNQSSTSILNINNNTITNAGNSGCNRYGLVFRNSGNVSNVKITNNIIYCYEQNSNSFALYHDLGTPNPVSGLPFISYNYLGSRNSQFSTFNLNNELNYQSTAGNGFGTLDTWGRAASGNTTCINMGNYLGEYYDIDLTRNDLGTYGGPYSIDNYLTTGTGKGKVLYINIKHQLTNINQVLDVKSSSGSKF